MQKVFAMSKGIEQIRKSLNSFPYYSLIISLVSFPVLVSAENANELRVAASRINGESLVYFILLLFIGYLFFRKPLP